MITLYISNSYELIKNLIKYSDGDDVLVFQDYFVNKFKFKYF